MSRAGLIFRVYFALAAIGLVWSWFYFFQYFSLAGSFLIGPFLTAVMANSASSGVAIDALSAGVVFSMMAVTCAHRDGVKWPWMYVLITFLVGLCVAMPLYLGFRERAGLASDRQIQA